VLVITAHEFASGAAGWEMACGSDLVRSASLSHNHNDLLGVMNRDKFDVQRFAFGLQAKKSCL
jgi:hypothetical protein